jgi:site-specific DNA-cytosine methylase
LGDVLLNGEMNDSSFYVDASKRLKEPLVKVIQHGFEVDSRLNRQGDVIELRTELDKWIYLKGRKAEERVSSKGVFYYKEGPLSLTDDLEKPSRTIITSEGGPGASRFKHLIEIKQKYRRLHPIELERLNMFPDRHTEIGSISGRDIQISHARRAFFMGNALVVGVVERIGVELNNRIII